MNTKRIDALYLLGIGVISISLGIFIVVIRIHTLQTLISFVGYALLGVGVLNTFRYIFAFIQKKDRNHKKVSILINMVIGIIIISFPEMPVSLFGITVGLYAFLLGIAHAVQYSILHTNRVPGRLFQLILAILYVGFGVFLLLSPYFRMDIVLVFIGVYFILYGLTYINDMINTILPNRYKNNVKRKIRITLPVFIEAMIPHFVLQELNTLLQPVDEDSTLEDTQDTNNTKSDEEADIEVFIHMSPKGFGMVGHVDICYKNKVISYGNYDANSQRLLEIVGDGVLFYANRDEYIPFVIEDSRKKLFSFGIKLNEEQIQKVDQKIKSIESELYRWIPPFYVGRSDMYATRLSYFVETDFYKFNGGKFRTYYVVGTNCVLLADQILASTGIDVLTMSGIITPGTYYEYLNSEYLSQRNFVIRKTLYS